MLTNLQFLNGVGVDREEIVNNQNETDNNIEAADNNVSLPQNNSIDQQQFASRDPDNSVELSGTHY